LTTGDIGLQPICVLLIFNSTEISNPTAQGMRPTTDEQTTSSSSVAPTSTLDERLLLTSMKDEGNTSMFVFLCESSINSISQFISLAGS